MPITIREVHPSQRAVDAEIDPQQSSFEMIWHVEGSTEKTQIAEKVMATAPAIADDKYLNRIGYEPLGGGLWEATALYSAEEGGFGRALEPGEFALCFDTAGQTIVRTHTPQHSGQQSSDSNQRYGSNSVDYEGAINVRDTVPEGIESEETILEFCLRYRHAQGVVTVPYMLILDGLTQTRNAEVFLGFPVGVLRFLGGTGVDGTSLPATLTYRFAADSGQSDLVYGAISGVARGPHAHVWVDYAVEEDATAKVMKPVARGVHVHSEFPLASWAPMGLGI